MITAHLFPLITAWNKGKLGKASGEIEEEICVKWPTCFRFISGEQKAKMTTNQRPLVVIHYGLEQSRIRM